MGHRTANDFPIHELLKERWSPRAFAEKPVPPEILRSLFEAARWAASSFNDQPWAYIIATKNQPEEFSRIVSVLVESNAWAAKAPVLALSLVRLNFHHNGQPNRVALHDLGAASASLALEATSRGLAVHQMAGILGDKAREIFQIPPDWEPVAALAIGYPGDPATLPDKLRSREAAPRQRKPISAFVMSGRFGRMSPIAAPREQT
ncbi:MAG TPA: nitroreductase family protein [Methylomirabilota bacterium]|jgi:nitroreductase|nr:nitroreductase family protein [Methylomirabilota bacterium]